MALDSDTTASEVRRRIQDFTSRNASHINRMDAEI